MSTPQPSGRHSDVLIVGSGIMGAATAALIRERSPSARITMVDGGPPIGSERGAHLHDSSEPEIWKRYNARVSSGIQGLYAGDELLAPPVHRLEDLEPGLHRLGVLGNDGGSMPGAALAWNLGGMGAHWTAATPWPDESERFGDSERWESDLAAARRILRVSPAPLGPTVPGEAVLATLRHRFADVTRPGREAQPMPMAVHEVAGRLARSGPAQIFPPIATDDDDAFTLLTGALVVAVLHDGAHATGVTVRAASTGEEIELTADVVVVCADAMRTPQLLFASGIRPRALGRYLNEHAFVSNRVLLDLDRFGITLDQLPSVRPDETVTDSLWLPSNGDAQPYQVQIMARTYRDPHGSPLAFGVQLSVYVPIESRAQNRLVFSDDSTDILGMPRIAVEFGYSDADHDRIDGVVDFVAGFASELGEWDPATESKLLPAGSSLHYTGTVRSGTVDDGTSVCDDSGRVWAFDNLYLAGNGVVPTALACNSTLTGVVTAVRAAEAVVDLLNARPHRL